MIMDYEKKYKDALERAKVVCDDNRKDKCWQNWLTQLFPELKESENKDERIKKVIYGWICIQPSQFFDDGFSKEEMLAWVEKQGATHNIINILPSLGNNQVQAILEDMGMLDDNGQCPHTAEEIFKAGMEYAYNFNHKAVSSVILDVELLSNVLRKHLYTCVNKTNTYVRSEEDHITLSELINKIRADLIID